VNYTELSTAIVSYLEGNGVSGFTSEDINTFIRQAEKRTYNNVQSLSQRKNVIGNVTSGNEYLSLPADYLSAFSVAVVVPVTGQQFLINKDVNFIRAAFPDRTVVGVPKYYAGFDEDSFIVGPTPDSNYQVELHYSGYPESIVTANTTWLGTNFDPVLLYGALYEGYIHMKGEELLLKTYKQQYEEAVALLKQLTDGKNRQDNFRTPQVRYPVK
jgi:hypothetical protein